MNLESSSEGGSHPTSEKVDAVLTLAILKK
jgi:hypothetical protein